MERAQLVLLKLKPKARALGFNMKELKGIAAKIADNLASADDAPEEEVNAEIDTQIDAVLPYLSFGQSQANRLLDEWKKNHNVTDEDDDDPSDDAQSGSKKNPKNKGKGNEDEPAWFKSFREQQEARFAALEGEKTTSGRKAKLEALLKDTGAFGTRTLKSFAKMTFESDDDFEDFLSEVEEDLKALNQERADAGLSTLGTPPAAGGVKQKEEEVISDAEVEALAASF